MNSKRIYYAMIFVIVLLVAAIFGGAYMANLQLQRQAKILTDYKTKAAVLQREQAGLVKAKKDVATYSDLEKIAKTIVPQDKDQAQAVREIINIASEAGIKPTSITFPTSTLGTPTSSASSKQSALSQLTPVKGISGVYNLQITIQQDSTSPVPYTKFIDFLSRLEQNRRTAQVTSVLLQPSPTNRTMVSFTLTLDEYIKP